MADNAVVIGDVKTGRDCSIWFSTVLRGDVNSIRIGNGVNIQDGSVFRKSDKVSWICRNCGYIYEGETAPMVCPVCKYKQSFFEVKKPGC